MADLVTFLSARLDEDEAATHGGGRIAWLTYCDDEGQMLYTTVAAGGDGEAPWVADGRELAEPSSALVMYDEDRARREVTAKRRILERHRECGSGIGYCDDGGHGSDGTDPGCGEMEDLAAPYSDHPDYDEAWITNG